MFSDMAITVSDVSKRFEIYTQPRDRLLQFISFGKRQYFKEFWAIKNISFDVKKGETLGILGRNGSGKSTLLQIIAGTLAPTQGEVRTTGMLAALLELGSGFNPEFTGRENVYLNGALLGFSQAVMDTRFDAIANFADIGEHLDQPIKTYSSGMYVRLAFAVQACVEPQILIVDEALSVGDEKFQRKCFEYIDRLRTNGCAVILVTHSTATVEKFCQRAVLLHKGEMHGVGDAKKIVDQYHALLYSDEKAYLRYLNAQTPTSPNSSSIQSDMPEATLEDLGADISPNVDDNTGYSAMIRSWFILDAEGNPCEAFRSGDWAKIVFIADILAPIKEIQAGLLIRTVEGVSAFGTSSVYHKANYLHAMGGEMLRVEFVIQLQLCEGAYFVTLSLAEAIPQGDMNYLDRKTDVIILRISEQPILGSGIAALVSSVVIQVAN